MRMAHYSKSIILIGIGLIGFAGGYIVKTMTDGNGISSASFAPIKQQGVNYTFIHPLLAYKTPEATASGDYISLKNSFQATINAATRSGRAMRVGVYFRDLDTGKWVGINQDDAYHPASLLKVPVMIAYEKEKEENPSLFADYITYDPSVIPNIPFEATSTLVAQRSYAVEKLIETMIVDSDNGATFALLNRINPEFLKVVYAELGIQDPGDDSANYKISARSYGLFFRILYNATYLSHASSEQALDLLSKATYANGLVAGVPNGTPVAHKYGEYILSQGAVATGVELSDCGIVYYPKHPYLLCVMASAVDVPSAEKIIADLSRASYTAVAERYPTR